MFESNLSKKMKSPLERPPTAENAPDLDFYIYATEDIATEKIQEWIKQTHDYLQRYKNKEIQARWSDVCQSIARNLTAIMLLGENGTLASAEAAKLVLIAQSIEKQHMLTHDDFYRDLDNGEVYGKGQNSPNETFNNIDAFLAKRLKDIAIEYSYTTPGAVFDTPATTAASEENNPNRWTTVNLAIDQRVQNTAASANAWTKILPEEQKPILYVEPSSVGFNKLFSILKPKDPSHITIYGHGTFEGNLTPDLLKQHPDISCIRFSKKYKPMLAQGLHGYIDTAHPEDTWATRENLIQAFGWGAKGKTDTTFNNKILAEAFAKNVTPTSMLLCVCDSGMLGLEMLKQNPSLKKIICFDGPLPLELARILEPTLHFLLWATKDFDNPQDEASTFSKSIEAIKQNLGIGIRNKAARFAEENPNITPEWMQDVCNMQSQTVAERILEHLVLLQKK